LISNEYNDLLGPAHVQQMSSNNAIEAQVAWRTSEMADAMATFL
jgi:hypothetical protein